MVNPPPVPADKDALEWVPRIQLAAAQVVGHIGGGWQSSGDALLSALWGPRDWITVAALITLAHLEENREIELDVHDASKTLSEFIPDGGPMRKTTLKPPAPLRRLVLRIGFAHLVSRL